MRMPCDLVEEMIQAGARQRREAAAQRKADLAAWREAGGAKAKKRGTPEMDLQKGIVLLGKQAFPHVLIAAVQNERGAKSKDKNSQARYGAARKASGVVAGFPDLICCLPKGRTLYLELKSPDGRISAAQRLVHARLADNGHRVVVIRTLDDAAAALREALR